MPDFEKAAAVSIAPRKLRGTLSVPAGKSRAVRLIFCASLCIGTSVLKGITLSEDVQAAMRCAGAFGADIRIDGDRLTVTGTRNVSEPVFDCGESAAVLRFAIPAAMALCRGGRFVTGGRLLSRPLEPYMKLFGQWGTEFGISQNTLNVSGFLPGGEHIVAGNVSSQFVSGLLTALPLVGGGAVRTEGPLQSKGYADMTVNVLRTAGIDACCKDGVYYSCGDYKAFSAENDGDWSQAAFWYAAKHLGAELNICGTDQHSDQPDRRIVSLFARMASDGDLLIDLSQNPDLLPPLAVMAAVRMGSCRFTGLERLKYKESDRLGKTQELLSALGADIRTEGSELFVNGAEGLRGGTVDCCRDHRLAMMAAIAACACREPVIIEGADSVNKSYPDFFRQYEKLGGKGCVTVLR